MTEKQKEFIDKLHRVGLFTKLWIRHNDQNDKFSINKDQYEKCLVEYKHTATQLKEETKDTVFPWASSIGEMIIDECNRLKEKVEDK